MAAQTTANQPTGSNKLAEGVSSFQRDTAPLVREELARLAREGQTPSQLFVTCSDSRLVTSMITSSGPGDLFAVRNVGNFVPPPEEDGDDSVAAAVEYAVDVLGIESITVCGHSGCGAMQALLSNPPRPADTISGDANASPGAHGTTAPTPLNRWLRHGMPTLRRLCDPSQPGARIGDRGFADPVEELCLVNVLQQLDNLRAHPSVALRLAAGTLDLHGLYFHVGEAQAYLLENAGRGSEDDTADERAALFHRVAGSTPPDVARLGR